MRILLVASAVMVTFAGAVRADFTLIPIPEIITDPNEGVTYGLLPVLLLTDPHDRVEHIVASDLRYNKTTGVYPAFRLFGYPTDERRYFVIAKQSEKIDDEFEGQYDDTSVAGGRASFFADLDAYRDSLQRFFGLGNHSAQADETNFTMRRFAASLRLGIRLWRNWQVAWLARFEDTAVQHGGVRSLPFTGDRFPTLLGLGGSTIHGEAVEVAYDDRDSKSLPTRGAFAAARFEAVDRALGSSESYSRFGFEARDFIPLHRRIVLALRGELDYTAHAAVAPFYELSSIGGEQSVRGFGDGRFRDANRFLASAEARTEVLKPHLFGVDIGLEVAPFVDGGRVFRSMSEFPVQQLHVAGGVGFRAVIRPQVVAFVDLGYGSEGGAAFSGLDYPF